MAARKRKRTAWSYVGWRRAGAALLLAGFFGLGFYLAGLYAQISTLIEQRKAALTSSVYSAPGIVRPGDSISQSHLLDRLQQLSYTPVANVTQPGEYRLSSRHLVVYRRAFKWGVEDFPSLLFFASLDQGRITRLRDVSGTELRGALIEPEVIGRLLSNAPAQRVEVPLRDLKPYLVKGLLATEDRFFYYNPGFDPIRIIEAAITDLREHRLAQGASTITQQLARTFLSRQRTFSRKLKELAVAIVLELRLSKNGILERYINDVPMGDYQGVPIYGLPMAARYLFNKDLRAVTPAEAATLIGMIRAPSLYNPRTHPALARARRDVVLGLMRRAGVISRAQYQLALASPITVRPPFTVRRAPYFVDYVASQVKAIPGFNGDLTGLTVYTTLDPEKQKIARDSVDGNLRRLEQAHRWLRSKRDPLESSMVAIDPATGAIRALVGGRDYSRTQYDRAVMAERQPGSAFKPIVFVTALDPRLSPLPRPFTLASLLPDERMSFGGWMPANYEHTYKPEVTVAETLADSLNVPTAYLGSLLGPRRIIQTAHEFGMHEHFPDALSISIGAGDVTLLELVSAYQVFADAGVAHRPYAIRSVIDRQGHLIYAHEPDNRRLLSPAVAYLITGALKGVVQYGTGASAAALGLRCPAAGKTGTTDNYRDAYFVGYTPALVTGVWVGRDTPRSIGLTGARAALPAWVEFMRGALPASCQDFPVPRGITMAAIDPDTGGLATPACPHHVVMPFLTGTQPTRYCVPPGNAPPIPLIAGAAPSLAAGAPAPAVAANTPAAPSPGATGGFLSRVAGFFGTVFGRH